MKTKKLCLILTILSVTAFFSCTTTNSAGKNASRKERKSTRETSEGRTEAAAEKTQGLLLTFAGDIMAHSENTVSIEGYGFNDIYSSITNELKESDFSFANFEAVVDDTKPYSSYPAFNVREEYAQAAIDAGFNVFSLSNNHTYDLKKPGLKSTREYFKRIEAKYKDSERPVYACGIKEDNSENFTFRTFEKNGWKILFMAVTGIANWPGSKGYDFVGTKESARADFMDEIKRIRLENPCDLFILSFHTPEEEYVLSVDEKQRIFFHRLIDSGVDVLWINHPHVAKEWEVICDENKTARKIIFFSMGNTISGQRRDPQFSAPQTLRDYTGDGLISQVMLEKDEDGSPRIEWMKPLFITTYINESEFYKIERLDDNFIESLRQQKNTRWANYLAERKKLMEKIKGKSKWQ